MDGKKSLQYIFHEQYDATSKTSQFVPFFIRFVIFPYNLNQNCKIQFLFTRRGCDYILSFYLVVQILYINVFSDTSKLLEC